MEIDRAAEWRRLKETYRQMSEEELTVIAGEAYQLTELARQAVEAEIASRNLDVKLQPEPPETDVPAQSDDDREGSITRFWPDNAEQDDEEEGPQEFDPEELDLIVLRRVWDMQEARTAKTILDNAGIPSYLGDENIENLDDYKGTFEGGIDMKISSVDRGWAAHAIALNWPDSPDAPQTDAATEDQSEYAICCPKCQSAEVVFEGRDGEMKGNAAFNAKFEWRCDACGHTWQDDGVEQPV